MKNTLEMFGRTYWYDDIDEVINDIKILKELSNKISEPQIFNLSSGLPGIYVKNDENHLGERCILWLVNDWHKSGARYTQDKLLEILQEDEDKEYTAEANKDPHRRKLTFNNSAQNALKDEMAKYIRYLSLLIEKIKNEENEMEKAEKTLYEQQMLTIEKIDTVKKPTYDESEKSIKYIHTVTFKDGEVLTFSDRTIFDVGRFISPMFSVNNVDHPVCINVDGVLTWNDWNRVFLRNLTANESVALAAISNTVVQILER